MIDPEKVLSGDVAMVDDQNMTADERILENEIDRAAILLQCATTDAMRGVYLRRLESLHARRTPKRVHDMERAAGLLS